MQRLCNHRSRYRGVEHSDPQGRAPVMRPAGDEFDQSRGKGSAVVTDTQNGSVADHGWPGFGTGTIRGTWRKLWRRTESGELH
jgi:hypothetical protein